jgi:hypothetical protein
MLQLFVDMSIGRSINATYGLRLITKTTQLVWKVYSTELLGSVVVQCCIGIHVRDNDGGLETSGRNHTELGAVITSNWFELEETMKNWVEGPR